MWIEFQKGPYDGIPNICPRKVGKSRAVIGSLENISLLFIESHITLKRVEKNKQTKQNNNNNNKNKNTCYKIPDYPEKHFFLIKSWIILEKKQKQKQKTNNNNNKNNAPSFIKLWIILKKNKQTNKQTNKNKKQKPFIFEMLNSRQLIYHFKAMEKISK